MAKLTNTKLYASTTQCFTVKNRQRNLNAILCDTIFHLNSSFSSQYY